jgi:ornithine cyclodeaminase/alanine dehydrogenase-like protein (mu-crystallin family)
VREEVAVVADLLFLSADQVAALVVPASLLDAQRRALVMLSRGTASVPGRGAAHAPRGMIESMPGYLPGMGYGAKLISFTPGNPARGLPLHHALLTLFDPDTGAPLAVLNADVLTAKRTAAVSAIATELLARTDARALAVIGSGVQAAAHLEFLLHVREFTDVRIASRNQATADALVRRHPQAHVVNGARAAATGADVICCCTSASEPVLDASWLSPGAHINSVGIGREVNATTAELARIFVEGRAAACAPYPSGALELEGLAPESLTELGEVLDSGGPGRTSASELTFFKSVGHAVEDMAAGHLVYLAACEQGAGHMLHL